MSLNRLKTITLLFILTIILSGCYAAKHGWEMSDYEKMGWMEVDFQKIQGKTGYNRLQSDMKLSDVVKYTIETKGYPDYLKVNPKNIINLAYIDKGHIMTIYSSSWGGRVIGTKNYMDFKGLTRKIFDDFTNNRPSEQSTKHRNNSLEPLVINTMTDKPVLVLLPIQVDSSDEDYASEFGAAIQEGLSHRYEIFYGPLVEEQLKKEYQKIDCNIESCRQNIAIAFNGELIADASTKKLNEGYILKLVISSILTGKVIKSKTYPCDSCDKFDVIRRFKLMGKD
jgi:hypothetical protein